VVKFAEHTTRKTKHCLWQFLTLSLILLASPSIAQEELPLPLQTRFGVLNAGTVARCNQEGDVCSEHATLSLNGDVIGEYDSRIVPDQFIYMVEWDDKDVLLLKLWSGGTSCCASYRFMVLDENGTHYSDEFGHHGHTPTNFEFSDNQISFRLERDYPENIDHWQITFDGETVDIEIIYEDDTNIAPAGNGPDVTRWEGEHPNLLWGDGSERNRFRQIMDDGALNCLRTSTSNNSSPFALKDGFLISDGFWPRQNGSRQGYIAIEVATGRPFSALMWGNDILYFGAHPEDFPATLKTMIEQDVEQNRTRAREHFGDRLAELESDYPEFCS